MRTFLLSILFLVTTMCFAQRGINQNLKGFDENQRIHFGFYVGINYMQSNVKLNNSLYTTDTIYSLNVDAQPGFSLGVVTNLHLGPYVDLRAMFPSLIFGQRDFNYRIQTDDGIFNDVRSVESTYLSIPIEMKFKSERYGNWRGFLLAGGDVGYDMVSKKNVDQEDKSVIRLQKWDYSYSVGFGFEFFLEYFKFGTQFKWNKGINNLMINDGTPFTNIIDQLKSQAFTISITFEG